MKLLRNPFCTLTFFVFIWCAPLVLHAETIVVRSGEHAGFTRIVLDLLHPRSWTLKHEKDLAQLVLKGPKASFDLSNAFRKINADRVRELHVADAKNTLEIGLNCDCAIETFQLGMHMLVIDIKGEVTPSKPLTKLSFSRSATAIPDRAYLGVIEQEIPLFALPPTRRLSLGFSPSDNSTRPQTNRSASESSPVADIPTVISTINPGNERRVSDAERLLAEQLARAVSQGLIEPHAARLPKPKTLTPMQPKAGQRPSEPPRSDERRSPPGLNLRAKTSADRDFLEAFGTGNVALNTHGEACLSDYDVDVNSWSGNATFNQNIGSYRSALVAEFDRPNPDAVRDLTRLYIYHGFGAEALLVLKFSRLAEDEQRLLQSISEIIEYGYANNPDSFSNQFDCNTSAALWAILAYKANPKTADVNGSAILRAVNGLPPHLRSLLGPEVSERLRFHRREDLANEVLRAVARGTYKANTQLEMAQVDQHLSEGELQSASDKLSKVIEANNDLSPQALVKLIDSRVAANLQLDRQFTELAGAYAQEYRKQPLGAALKRVHILALSEVGEFDEAFREISLLPAHSPPETVAQIRSQTMSKLAQKGEELVFLKHALSANENTISILSPASANAVAERLIELGFAASSESYLRPGADQKHGRERRLLRARAALQQKKPRRAEVNLLGLAGEEADILRAQARSMSGDHQSAQGLFAALDQPDLMIEEAWLSGDWPALQKSGDALWNDVAELTMQDDVKPNLFKPQSLTENHALLVESSKARQTISELLARYTLESALPAIY